MTKALAGDLHTSAHRGSGTGVGPDARRAAKAGRAAPSGSERKPVARGSAPARVLGVRGSRCATHRPVGLVCRATWRPVVLAPQLPPARSCLRRSRTSGEPHDASTSSKALARDVARLLLHRGGAWELGQNAGLGIDCRTVDVHPDGIVVSGCVTTTSGDECGRTDRIDLPLQRDRRGPKRPSRVRQSRRNKSAARASSPLLESPPPALPMKPRRSAPRSRDQIHPRGPWPRT